MGTADEVLLDRDLPLAGILPTAAERAELGLVEVSPLLGPDFAFNMLLPRSWTYHPSTEEIALEEGPVPLGVFSKSPTMRPPTLVSVGALRANTRVSLMTFFAGYCHITGMTARAMRPIDGPALRGIDGIVDPQEDTRMRLVMIEDGGRVLVLAGMSLRSGYAAEARGLAMIMFSVEFLARRGPTMALVEP